MGSDEKHFDEHGHHNADYDHEAFLGEDEAMEFKQLTPEESKERLAQIVDRIDINNDTVVDLKELRDWIKMTAEKSTLTRTEEFWMRSNPGNKEELSWDEYRAIQYGFLTDEHITDHEGRWVGEDDVDEDMMKMYKQLEMRDKRRWNVADRDKNLVLSKAEFQGFIHPETVPYMKDIVLEETMADLDKDGDMKIGLPEFVKNIYGDDAGATEWDNAGMQFRKFRDINNDGLIDKYELEAWILPPNVDLHEREAEHLIHDSDTNGDKMLTKKEILDNYTVFVSSQATNFGEDLHGADHDEL